jgi:hypothetical protein
VVFDTTLRDRSMGQGGDRRVAGQYAFLEKASRSQCIESQSHCRDCNGMLSCDNGIVLSHNGMLSYDNGIVEVAVAC